MNDKDENVFGILIRVCDSICAVPIQHVTSVDVLTENPTPIPHSPHHTLGICRLHGKDVSIIDLGQILGSKHSHKLLTPDVIIIINSRVGLLIDEILGTDFLYSCQSAGPAFRQSIHDVYTCKSRDEMILGLDVPHLLSLC